MKKLFWLNSSTSSPKKASSAVFKVKADEGEQEEEAAEKPVRFPICTALSPSSKAKALAAKMGHNPEQKRLSLDSGYADSNEYCHRYLWFFISVGNFFYFSASDKRPAMNTSVK